MGKFKKGDVIYAQYPENAKTPHMCIVLCDSDGLPETAIVVPVNTLDNETTDTSTILKPGDHSFIIHDSVVTYKLMESVYVDELISRNARIMKPVSQEVFERILQGVKKSDDVEKRLISALNKRLGLSL